MIEKRWIMICMMLAIGWYGPSASADPFSMLDKNALGRTNGSLFTAAVAPASRSGASSLFSDRQEGSLFAPYPTRAAPRHRVSRLGSYAAPVVKVREIIENAESRKHGYDAVQFGARVRPSKRPTQMTIGEIYAWIDATPGQPHAIGRYQFIPATLRRLVRLLALGEHEVFSPEIQDRLSDVLLDEAGYGKFRAGQMTRHEFMNNLAKIWAGLPTSSGRSYYDGYAGNKASLTWEDFDAQMAQIFPS